MPQPAVGPTYGTALSALISFLKEVGYNFITPTPATHLRINARPGNQRAEDLTDAFGWSRPFASSLLPDQLLHALHEGALITKSDGGWKSVVRASTLERNLFLHSAFPTFTSDAVFFGPDTYRFARAIKTHLSEVRLIQRALDLGCGSGAGGVVLAKNSICHELILSDINATALQMARLNADAAAVQNVTTIHSNLFENIDGRFDLIVANPPYLNDPLQRIYRHGGGAFGSDLSIRIAQEGKDRLSPGGSLLLYTGSPIVDGMDLLLQNIEQTFTGCDLLWVYEEVDPDVFGEELETAAYNRVERIAAVVLTIKRKGSHVR